MIQISRARPRTQDLVKTKLNKTKTAVFRSQDSRKKTRPWS